jgi:hypothetical protein
MAATYDETVRGSAYDVYRVFRGNFTDVAGVATNPFVVGDRWVILPGGRVNGYAKFSPISSGIPDAVGAPPERFSTSMEIDNSDYSFSDALIGTTGVDPALEYRGDSVLNLQGRIYHGVRDPVSGSYFEKAITPVLVCSAEPVYDGTKVTIPLSSKEERVLGPSYRPITVRMLTTSTVNGDGVTKVDRSGAVTALPDASWEGVALNDNLDELVPWVYGRAVIPLVLATNKENLGNDGRSRFVVALADTGKKPTITDFSRWQFFSETYGRVSPWSVAQDGRIAADCYLTITRRNVSYKDPLSGLATNTLVWVVILTTWQWNTYKTGGALPDQAEILEKQQYVIPYSWSNGIFDSVAPPPIGTPGGPAKMIEEILHDHASTVGIVDSTSLTRTKKSIKGRNFGGVYYGDSPMADVVSHTMEAAGILVWLDIDGLIHFAPNGSWNADDKLLAESAATLQIRQLEVVQGWNELIPRDPARRGAGASRVDLNWPGEVKKMFKNGPNGLPTRAPGSTRLPLGGVHAAEVSAAWVYPIDPIPALQGQSSARWSVRRRINFVGRGWFASILKGTLFFLSHVRGLGAGGSTGYDRRVVRLERCTYDPQNDLCELAFEDLGSVVAVKGARIDAFANWNFLSGSGNITLTAASQVVVASAPYFNAGMVGRYLDTSGAVNRGNKRQRKITIFTDTTHVTVERQYTNTETIVAGFHPGSPTLEKWYISRAHSAEVAGFRSDYWRNCSENGASAGLLRNGDRGYQVVPG